MILKLNLFNVIVVKGKGKYQSDQFCKAYGTMYSSMYQVKFVEGSF